MELRALFVLHPPFDFDALVGAALEVALMSRMRFAVDVRSLMDRPTGIGRYAQQLVAQLQRVGDLVLYSFGGQRPSPALAQLAQHAGTRFVHHRLPMRVVRRLWRAGLGRWLESVVGDFDVAVAAETTMPRTRRPVLAVVHDLLFLEHPEWFNDYTRRAGPENLADVVGAAQVITVSRRTQRALLAFHPALADRCHLVPPAVSPSTVP